jgi:SAM-dependent methyltransferase
MKKKDEIRASIRKNYAKVAKGASSGCCSSGCCCGGAPINVSEASFNIGYSEYDLANTPSESNMGLGCGNPLAIASLKEGEIVLDLGSGGGFDCFLARRQVGESGYVIGVDMTPDMIELARRNAVKSGYNNVEFRLGEIEHLPVKDSSIDIILSNCVINLSPDKEQVFREAYRVLKPGGRLSTSDVVAIQKLPEGLKHDLDSIASCIGGAEHVENLKIMMQKAGFENIKLTPKSNSREIIKSWNFGEHVEDYVASYLIEATKE